MVLKQHHKNHHHNKVPHENRKLRRVRKVRLIYDKHHHLIKKIPLEKFHYVQQKHHSKRDLKDIKKYKKIIETSKKDKIKYI